MFRGRGPSNTMMSGIEMMREQQQQSNTSFTADSPAQLHVPKLQATPGKGKETPFAEVSVDMGGDVGLQAFFVEATARTEEESLPGNQHYDVYQAMANLPEGFFDELCLSTTTNEENERYATYEVNSSQPSGINSINSPLCGGEFDRPCQRCYRKDCSGHFGILRFAVSLYHPRFFPFLINVLKCICPTCGNLLCSRESLERKGIFQLPIKERLSRIVKESKTIQCQRKYTTAAGRELVCSTRYTYHAKASVDVGNIMYSEGRGEEAKNKKPMPIADAKAILECLSDEDAQTLTFKSANHVKSFIMDNMLVMPMNNRPDNILGGDRVSHKITKALGEVVNKNESLQVELNKFRNGGHASGEISQKTNDLYQTVKNYMNIVLDFLQGKRGTFRGLSFGSRGQFVARAVIIPSAASHEVDTAEIPERFCSDLLVQETANVKNIERLQKLLRDGKVEIIQPTTGPYNGFILKVKKRASDKEVIIQPGDIVMRHCQDGDIVVLNRQPTLSKGSMLAFFAKIITDRRHGRENVIGLAGPTARSFNADHDGDEMNVSTVSAEARQQVIDNMMVDKNIRSPANSSIVIAPDFNSILAAYLISLPGVIVSPSFLNNVFVNYKSLAQLSTLRSRLKIHGVSLYTGRGLISSCLPADLFYSNKNVEIRNGIYISGKLNKSVLRGSESIMSIILSNYGSSRTMDFIRDFTYATSTWLVNHGFSLSYTDCDLSVYGERDSETGKTKAQMIIDDYTKKIGKMERDLGPEPKDRDSQAYEIYARKAESVYNQWLNAAIKIFKSSDLANNPLTLMSTMASGAKGTDINLSYMAVALGPTFEGENLIARNERSNRYTTSVGPNASIIDPNIDSPCCQDNFVHGLGPEGVIEHLQGSRPGVVATALSQSATGYAGKRAAKGMEPCITNHGAAVFVKDNRHVCLMTVFGGNGYDPQHVSVYNNSSGFSQVTPIDIFNIVETINSEEGYIYTGEGDYRILDDPEKLYSEGDVNYPSEIVRILDMEIKAYNSQRAYRSSEIQYYEAAPRVDQLLAAYVQEAGTSTEGIDFELGESQEPSDWQLLEEQLVNFIMSNVETPLEEQPPEQKVIVPEVRPIVQVATEVDELNFDEGFLEELFKES